MSDTVDVLRCARMTHEPVFFAHMMRTGGTSIGRQVRRRLPRSQVYGTGSVEGGLGDSIVDKMSARRLAEEPVEVKSQLRFVGAHLPIVASELLGRHVVTATILRHPVERVVSFLNRTLEYLRDGPSTISELYDDGWYGPRLCRNQVKVMSMTLDETLAPDDPVERYGLSGDARCRLGPGYRDFPIADDLPMDETRLADAKSNLEDVDVLGIFEQYPAFVAQLSEALDVPLDPDHAINIGHPVEVKPDLVARIEEDTRLDLELYEHARALVASRV